MAGAKNHQYHILPPSVWPLIGSISALTFTTGMVLFMHEMANAHLVLGLGIAEPADGMLPEKRLFKFSILYLFALFAALVVDAVLRNQGILA